MGEPAERVTDRVYTPEEFQAGPLEGKVSLYTIYDLLRRGALPAFKVGRKYFIREEAWLDYVRQQEASAGRVVTGDPAKVIQFRK